MVRLSLRTAELYVLLVYTLVSYASLKIGARKPPCQGEASGGLWVRPDIALLAEQLANLSHLVDMRSIPHMFSIAYYVDSMFCRVILLSYRLSRNAILLLCPWM